MRVFSGKGGSVYELGELFQFTQIPLRDSGGGWDWFAPEDLRYWSGDVSFEVWDGTWQSIMPLEVYHRSGRVSFDRCLEGKHVRASGVCRPASLVSTGDRWRLEVETLVSMTPMLGSEFQQSTAKSLGSSATIEGIENAPSGPMFVWLPFVRGVFIGLGQLWAGRRTVTITFDDEGVVYEPA